jgi:hypothetical protein
VSVIGHDLGLVLESIADIAVLVAQGTDLSIIKLILIAQIAVPLIVVALPGNVVFQQDVPDAPLRGWGDRERGVVGVCVGVSVASVSEIARVVIVQEVVVTGIAIWVDWRIQRTEIRDERPIPGCEVSEQLL